MTPIANIVVQSTLTLRWFAISPAGTEGAAHGDGYGVDATNQSVSGYVTRSTTLDGLTPVVTTSAGQTLGVAGTTFQIWVQSGCPGCQTQLVYGVDNTDQGCLYDGSPNVYPGSGTVTRGFSVTAPGGPGVHEVRVAQIEELSCSIALTRNALANRPNVTRIGVIIVK